MHENVFSSRHQDTLETVFKPLKVLELGSGTGVLGLCVAGLGCKVVLTDPSIDLNLSEEQPSNTITLLKENLKLNKSAIGERLINP